MTLEDYFDFSHPNEIRLRGHRINVETILFEYLDGMVPEEIVAQHPTLSLEQVYATITYYWHNQQKMVAYLREADALAQRMLREQEFNPPPGVIRLRQLLRQRRQQTSSLERQAIIHREAEAWHALPQSVRDRYGSEFVAVHDGEVVDHDPDRQVLYRRVREKFGSRPILITPAHAPLPREFQILNPRIVGNS